MTPALKFERWIIRAHERHRGISSHNCRFLIPRILDLTRSLYEHLQRVNNHGKQWLGRVETLATNVRLGYPGRTLAANRALYLDARRTVKYLQFISDHLVPVLQALIIVVNAKPADQHLAVRRALQILNEPLDIADIDEDPFDISILLGADFSSSDGSLPRELLWDELETSALLFLSSRDHVVLNPDPETCLRLRDQLGPPQRITHLLEPHEIDMRPLHWTFGPGLSHDAHLVRLAFTLDKPECWVQSLRHEVGFVISTDWCMQRLYALDFARFPAPRGWSAQRHGVLARKALSRLFGQFGDGVAGRIDEDTADDDIPDAVNEALEAYTFEPQRFYDVLKKQMGWTGESYDDLRSAAVDGSGGEFVAHDYCEHGVPIPARPFGGPVKVSVFWLGWQMKLFLQDCRAETRRGKWTWRYWDPMGPPRERARLWLELCDVWEDNMDVLR